MFTDVYLSTTNPELPISNIISIEVIFSVIFHTIVYAGFFNLASYIFLGKILSRLVNARLLISLSIIMFFGFFARFVHVKEIYKSYNYNLEKTRNHMDKLYISWVFIS
jgi:hypothetical protein